MRTAIVSGISGERITLPLSMTSTALVLCPQVASMTFPASRASCTIRRTGAASGDTTAISLCAAAMFPYPTLMNFIPSSLHILDLLAQLFDLALQVYDMLGYNGV